MSPPELNGAGRPAMGGSTRIQLGQVAGAFGIQGWIRVQSHCRPATGILDHECWLIAGREWTVLDGRAHGPGVVARLEGVDDRDAAAELAGQVVELAREALPDPEAGTYYWADLIGCEVARADGQRLGTVERMFENGVQDVLVVRGAGGEVLIPFVPGPIVLSVDLSRRLITVQWGDWA